MFKLAFLKNSLMKIEKFIINWLPYICLVIGLVLFPLFWCDINDKFQTIILFLTLIAVLFYVKDTHRLADVTGSQFRAYWISNLFVSLSVRLDGIMYDINNVGALPPGKWEEHRAETCAIFDAIKGLSPSKEFEKRVNQERKDVEDAFSLGVIDKKSKKQVLSLLRNVKSKLQVLVGQLV